MKNIIDVRDYSAICHVSSALGDLSQCSEYFTRALHELAEDGFSSNSERVRYSLHFLSLCHSALKRAHDYISWYEEGLVNLEKRLMLLLKSTFSVCVRLIRMKSDYILRLSFKSSPERLTPIELRFNKVTLYQVEKVFYSLSLLSVVKKIFLLWRCLLCVVILWLLLISPLSMELSVYENKGLFFL